jgi:hypothetical protein
VRGNPLKQLFLTEEVEEKRGYPSPEGIGGKRADTPLKITIFMGRGECQTHGRFS